jgi:hypothetical protein
VDRLPNERGRQGCAAPGGSRNRSGLPAPAEDLTRDQGCDQAGQDRAAEADGRSELPQRAHSGGAPQGDVQGVRSAAFGQPRDRADHLADPPKEMK